MFIFIQDYDRVIMLAPWITIMLYCGTSLLRSLHYETERHTMPHPYTWKWAQLLFHCRHNVICDSFTLPVDLCKYVGGKAVDNGREKPKKLGTWGGVSSHNVLFRGEREPIEKHGGQPPPPITSLSLLRIQFYIRVSLWQRRESRKILQQFFFRGRRHSCCNFSALP